MVSENVRDILKSLFDIKFMCFCGC